MTRRTLWLTILSLFLVAAASTASLATEPPVVRQPTDPFFSTSDRVGIANAASEIEKILREGYPIPAYRLESHGWLDRDFILFVAGVLASYGNEVVLVESGTRLWILVGVQLAADTAWIPVEASPSAISTAARLGKIPWAGG